MDYHLDARDPKRRQILAGVLMLRPESQVVLEAARSLPSSKESSKKTNIPKCSEILAIDCRILYGMFQFFGTQPQFRTLEWVRRPSSSNFTKFGLPVELQLAVLENLRISEMDRALRYNFPHLMHLLLPSFCRRATEQFGDLCSRENLRYAGSYVSGVDEMPDIVDLYRLRSLDLHPWFKIPATNGAFQVEYHQADPLFSAKSTLMNTLEGLYWSFKRESLIKRRTHSRKCGKVSTTSKWPRIDDSDVEADIEALEKTSLGTPFVIPLFDIFDIDTDDDTDPGHGSSIIPI